MTPFDSGEPTCIDAQGRSRVFSRMPIRKKIVFALVMLAILLVMLIGSGLRGFYAYRELVVMVSGTVSDLPRQYDVIARLVDQMRIDYQPRAISAKMAFEPDRMKLLPTSFAWDLRRVHTEVLHCEAILKVQSERETALPASDNAELKLIRETLTKLHQIEDTVNHDMLVNPQMSGLMNDLTDLSNLVHELPHELHKRMVQLRDRARVGYRMLFVLIILSAAASFTILGFGYIFFRRSVVQPFKELLAGSRSIAKGNFDHRIVCNSNDEMAELAQSMNAMTDRFVEIRDHLNEKVQERTREVVRSEQLASVGFLAAGVAHEINNPLASIAWSAEAIEMRLHEVLHGDQTDGSTNHTLAEMDPAELDVLRKYLKRIQDEAFRCKGITERLLDFSRLGESQRRQECNVSELVADVVALVEHLAPYRNKKIQLLAEPDLMAWASPTEMKQVVLNLLTNALDSTDDNGLVTLHVGQDAHGVRLVVEDNGCGMTDEVLRHLFEPFFTRRRDGKGTGLGLSITYRIVQDHGGQIQVSSEGPGHGSRFVITLPLPADATSHDTQIIAA